MLFFCLECLGGCFAREAVSFTRCIYMFGSAPHIAKTLVTSSHLVGWVAKRASDLQHLRAQCPTAASELLPRRRRGPGKPKKVTRRDVWSRKTHAEKNP